MYCYFVCVCGCHWVFVCGCGCHLVGGCGCHWVFVCGCGCGCHLVGGCGCLGGRVWFSLSGEAAVPAILPSHALFASLFLGACVNAANSEGYIPLHLAVRGGYVAAVRRLLEMGAQLHAETFISHIAPLHLAAYRGSVPCMEALLEYGADINVQESWGQTPLMLAALRGHTEALIYLLQNTNCDTHVREYQYGGQVAHVAMETKELATLQLLLDGGSDPNATRTSDGASLLQLAIEHRFTEGVQLLLKYGARCHPETLKDSRLSRQPLVAMATVQWGMYGLAVHLVLCGREVGSHTTLCPGASPTSVGSLLVVWCGVVWCRTVPALIVFQPFCLVLVQACYDVRISCFHCLQNQQPKNV